MTPAQNVVTGAFSYTGGYIARELLSRGRSVMTLSRRPAPEDPLASQVSFAPLQFEDPAALAESMRGATTLYNTYWIRFERGSTTFEGAVDRTMILLAAAREAGIDRVVHLSVTNASEDSPLPYFRNKAVLERRIAASGISHAIIRPTLIFGREDILVNNIAWALRRSPLFPVPGRGDYRVQPVSAEDVARLAVDSGEGRDDLELDAAGPDVLTYAELVRMIATAVGARARIVRAPAELVLFLSRLAGLVRRDVMLTREELDGLMASLLVSSEPPTGTDRFADWLGENADFLGRSYVSELGRNFRPYGG